jgi:hypothetical protein
MNSYNRFSQRPKTPTVFLTASLGGGYFVGQDGIKVVWFWVTILSYAEVMRVMPLTKATNDHIMHWTNTNSLQF